jgi:hypothetical protein
LGPEKSKRADASLLHLFRAPSELSERMAARLSTALHGEFGTVRREATTRTRGWGRSSSRWGRSSKKAQTEV